MKSLSIASLTLVLALSGCSSSPSIEEQTKLVEYEHCIKSSYEEIRDRYDRLDIATELQYSLNRYALILEESCAKYRP